LQPNVFDVLPNRIAGMSLEELRDDYRERLFNHYLPFWDQGGYDEEPGGFTCELNDDGSVFNDEKSIWYQGRAVWVYSFLYQHFGKNERFLEIAQKTKEFMVRHMHLGGGRWNDKVRRDGTIVTGPSKNVYGSLFAAAGLAEYYLVAQDPGDLDLAKQSIWAAVRMYDDADYGDTHTTQYTAVKIPQTGIRSQGHSMVLVWILSRLLTCHEDARLEQLQRQHVDMIMRRFWNPEYGIANEYLHHDYSRILKTMANTGHGVWRQAVDRRGKDLKRVGISTKRKGNFHQPRCLMLNLLSLERMIDNAGKLTPFPE